LTKSIRPASNIAKHSKESDDKVDMMMIKEEEDDDKEESRKEGIMAIDEAIDEDDDDEWTKVLEAADAADEDQCKRTEEEKRREQPGASSQLKQTEDAAARKESSGKQTEDAAARKRSPGKNDSGDEVAPVPQAGSDFEVRKHKIGRRPILPTKAEIEEHYPLHLHYRSWCKHCVAGKARANQHQSKDKDIEKLGTTWNADYCFMGGKYNESEDGMQPSLVMYDDSKDSFWAVGVDRKGASDAMVKFCVGAMDQSGYVGEQLTFKTDQEPSIIALKTTVAASRIGQTVPIESPVRASKSNGMMENAIKIWQGQLRTIKHHLESKLGKCVEPGGVLFSWLIRVCAYILNKFRVGADGRTAYERITAHKCKVAQIGFCEVVDFKLETDRNKRLKADSDSARGFFWDTHGEVLSIL
jgi:hypothetical protein